MATLATETFTGANGAAWPSQWTTATGSPAGVVDQQSGAGRLQANNASAWNASVPTARLTGVSSASLEVVATIKLSTTAILQFWPALGIGVTSSNVGSGYFTSGISVQFAAANNTYSVIGPDGTSLSGDIANTWAVGKTYRVRVQRLVSGTTGTVSVRVWDSTTTEPTSWQWTGSTTVVAAGSVAVLTGQGGDTTARPFTVDDITVTDAATGASYSSTGSASATGTATAASRLAARSTAAAGGTGSSAASTTARTTAAGSAGAEGTTQGATTLTATSTATAGADGTATATTVLATRTPGAADGEGTASATTATAATSDGGATGTGDASAPTLLQSTATGSATATGTASATNTARLTSTGAADGEGSAAASTDAPGTSSGDATGTGATEAGTRLTATSTAAAVAFTAAAALTVLAARTTGTATGAGTGAAGSTLRGTTVGAAVGTGSATATTSVRDQDHQLHLEVTFTTTDRRGALTAGPTATTLSFPIRGGTVG